MAAPEDEDVVADKPRPADPVLPPGECAKQNLFSSFASSLLTLFFGLLAFGAFWGLLKFTFNNPARRWDAVPTNMRLMFTQGYPTAHYARIWVSVGIIMALVGLPGRVQESPVHRVAQDGGQSRWFRCLDLGWCAADPASDSH